MLTYRKNIQVILIALAAAWPAFAGDAQDLSKLRQTYEQHRDAARAIETLNVDAGPVADVQAQLQTIRTQLEAAKRDLSDIRTRVERVMRTGGPKAASSLTQAGTPQTYVGQQQPIIDALEQQLQAAEQGLARRRGTLMQIQEVGRIEAERRGEEEIRRRQREQQAAAGDIDTLRALMRSVEDELVRSETELARLRQDTQDRERALNDQIAQLQRMINETRAELDRIRVDAAADVKACRDNEKRLQAQLEQMTRDRDAAQVQRDKIQAQRDKITDQHEKAVADYQRTLDLLNQANARVKAAEDKARADLKQIQDAARAAQEKAAADIKACQDDVKRIMGERDAANARIVQIGITPEERAKLQGDLKQLQGDLALARQRLAQELEKAKQNADQATADAKAALDKQTAQIAQLTRTNQEVSAALEQRRAEVTTLRAQVQQLSGTLADRDAAIANLEKMHAQLIRERQAALDEANRLREQLNTAQEKCKTDVAALQQQLSQVQAQLKACRDSLALFGDITPVQIQQLRTDLAQAQQVRKTAEDQLKGSQEDLKRLQVDCNAIQARIADLEKRPEQKTLDALQAELNKARSDLKNCQDQLGKCVTPEQLAQCQQELAALRGQLAECQQKLKECMEKPPVVCPPAGPSQADLQACRDELEKCQRAAMEKQQQQLTLLNTRFNDVQQRYQGLLAASMDESERVTHLLALNLDAELLQSLLQSIAAGKTDLSGQLTGLLSQLNSSIADARTRAQKPAPSQEKPAAGTAGQPDPGDAKRSLSDCESKLAQCQAELRDVLAQLKATNYPSPTIQNKIKSYEQQGAALPKVTLSPAEQKASIELGMCQVKGNVEAISTMTPEDQVDEIPDALAQAKRLRDMLSTVLPQDKAIQDKIKEVDALIARLNNLLREAQIAATRM